MYTKRFNKVLVLSLTFFLLLALTGAASAATYSYSKDFGPYTIKGDKGSNQVLVSVDPGRIPSVYGSANARIALNNNVIYVCSTNNIHVTQDAIKKRTSLALGNINYYSKLNKHKTLTVIYRNI